MTAATASRVMDTLLVPYDFTSESRAAFEQAERLARLADATIHLLHVVHPPMLHAVTPAGPLDLALPEVVVTGALLEAKELLLQVAEGSEAEVEVHVVEGLPTDAICTFAERLDADLIVMGTHGRAGLGHLLHGSVTERTLRRAPCPVLTVRAPVDSSAP